ncbi:hypothetical protein Barb4_04814 [Bacteroidales bacterium Barb4]|nr:hypothetical protein Barb4_04814 [Bacteroidales bacterium Barb4]
MKGYKNVADKGVLQRTPDFSPTCSSAKCGVIRTPEDIIVTDCIVNYGLYLYHPFRAFYKYP